jgi:hypothetical protein
MRGERCLIETWEDAMRRRHLLPALFAVCCAWAPGAHAQGYYPYPPSYYAPGYYPPGYYRPAPPPPYAAPYYPPPYYAPPPTYGSANCGTPDRFKPCYR